MPAHIASNVACTSSRVPGETRPMRNVSLLSPCQPSTTVAMSTFTMSPSRSRYDPGMPWQTTSLTLVQMLAG